MQNYKIFFNNVQIIIGNNSDFLNTKKINIIKPEQMAALVIELSSNTYQSAPFVWIKTNEIKDVFKKFKKHFKIIKAAGGVVFNEKGELLIMKRLGKWDLPKGKIEKGENTRLAALREVHEECGIHFLGITSNNSSTYHIYFLKGQWILKQTTWFNMVAWDEENLKPQLEEHITEVKWVDESFIHQKDFDTYETLKDIFKTIKFPKKK